MSQLTTGAQLTTFITALNGGATIDPTLLETLIDNGKTVLEEERPWMVLRKTDSSKTVTTANTWQTAIDLSNITNFDRLYDDQPMRLFDGINRVEYYDQVPFDRRLENKDVSNTFCYDENTKTLYLNGTVPFAGTLHINIIVNGSYIDPTSNTAVWTEFPARFLPLLGFYAVGVFKGAVDYDSINRLMLPSNQGALLALKEAMTAWDMEKQMSSLSHNDPTEQYSYPRAKAVDRTQ